MSALLATAPVSWGVWEKTVDRPDLVPPDRLLETARSLGYRRIELGPPGYLGGTPDAVRARLEPFQIDLVGAFTPLHLTDETAFRADLEELERTIAVLEACPGHGNVLLADAETPERLRAAGRPDELRRTALAPGALARAADRLQAAAERCRERGLTPAFHPHAATYFEAPAEIEALFDRTDPALVALCLDTGHTVVGGGDPLALARDLGERLAHLHLKDVDPTVLARLRDGAVDMELAWAQGLFCPLGEGAVDVDGFLALPAVRRFDGIAALEQDRMAVRLADLDAVRAVEERNLARVVEHLGVQVG